MERSSLGLFSVSDIEQVFFILLAFCVEITDSLVDIFYFKIASILIYVHLHNEINVIYVVVNYVCFWFTSDLEK